MKHYHILDMLVLALLIVGGLNWGLVGLFKFDLVSAIFGMMSVLSRFIYVLFGAAAVYRLVFWLKARAGK